jgi:hypothetical protein
VLHFGAQNPNRTAALAKAPVLAALELEALAGISVADRSRIVNFGLPGCPAFHPPILGAGQIQLCFATAAGQSYTVQCKHSLTETSWQDVQTVTGNGAVMTVVVPVNATTNGFYRLRFP